MQDLSDFATTAQPSAQADDPLLQCLVILVKLLNKPFSGAALTAGLPLPEHRLTPDLFIRAASRAGLSAQLIKRPLSKMTAVHLPAVLLLKDGQACIFLEQPAKQQARIILPESGEGTVDIALQELEDNYNGYALFARPIFQFDQRSADAVMPRPRHWFWGTIAQSWYIYTEVVLASLLINSFALASPLFIMNVYDRVVPNHALDTLWALALGAFIVFSFDFLMRNLRGYFIDIAGKRADIVLSSMVFEHVLGTRRASHPSSVGAFANHLQEFESFREFLTSATLSTLIDLPFALLFILVISWLSPDLALIPLLAMPLVIVFGLAIQLPLRRWVERTFRASAQKHALLIETLTGIETIKTHHAEGQNQRRWETLVGDISRASLRTRFLSALAVNFSLLVQQLTTIVVVVQGVYLIIDGHISVGALIASTILSGRALAPLAQIASLMTRYHQSVAALGALSKIMALPLERPTEQQFVHRPKLQGAIQFKQVNFRYPQQTELRLKNLSLTIQAGERVGIIGRIGSGKSTLAKLLLGLYQAEEGGILLDGIDLRQIDPADLRRNIGYVPQDNMLFYGTVRENIVLGSPHIDDAAMLQAAALAGVDEFVNRHPLGFDLPIGERGEGLSGGQRQAVSLARAFLLNPPLLLLDEPTNAMDNSTEEQFKQRLLPYLQDKTLLLVTHRTSLLSLVERLVVIDNGQLVADGPKEQVIQTLAQGQVKTG